MNYAIILAGGSGSRFWPLSRYYEPKQFLNICSARPMLEETIGRILHLVKRDNIYIATNKIYQEKTKSCLKGLSIPGRNILFEPEARNTLAPIGLLSKMIYEKNKEAVILVFPCDHSIKNRVKFQKALNRAIAVARRGYIVSLGVVPDRPQTGYGYIKVRRKNNGFYLIDRFIEKPDIVRAKKFIKDKHYYWNAGVFIFKAHVMLEEIRRLAPYDRRLITKINDKKSLNKLWPKFTSISIDYAIMEKSNKMALVPADFGWLDLGSWQAIEQLAEKDACGNIFRGRCVDLGSKNTIAFSDNRLLATLGLDNIIIVNTRDAILVCSNERTQDVKRLVEILKQKKLKKLL